MSWTINNQSPESLRLRVVNITKNSDTASEATLAVVADSYTEQASFNFGESVSLEFNGETVFTGTVFQTPRSADGSNEALEYTLKDSWYDLERLVYQVPRDYVKSITPPDSGDDANSTLSFVSSLIGTTTFDSDVPLGDRIKTIIDYASSKGLNITAGSIDEGINWYRTESKDRTCAEMVREFLKLMPDIVPWIDSTTSPPRFNLTSRSSMPEKSYTIGQDSVTDHSIVRHDSEKVPCVVIRYEKPITVDSENYTEIIEDIAPANADASQLGTMVETVGIQGGVYQNEYARITTDTIPQADASTSTIKEWWIQYTPQLLSIADTYGKDKVRDFLKLAVLDVPDQDIKKHVVTVVVDANVIPPKPLNPRSTIIPKSTDPKDFPRHIIEGVLPDWANKRYNPILAEATIGIKKTDLDGLADKDLQAAFKSIFTIPKTINGDVLLTALFTGQVMGTNAVSKNYKRVVTSDPGETPPTGIAAELLAQLNKDRFSGEISVVGQNPDTITQVGQILNVYGGRSEWGTMDETIQQVSHDVQEGTTSVSFGPPQNLLANDLIDRLRASRVNQFGYRMQSGNDVEEGIGGGSASPVFSFSIQNSGAVVDHPWLVTLGAGTSSIPATVTKGKIFKGLLNVEEITPVLTVLNVTADTFMCLEYTYADESVKNIVVAEADYEAFTESGGDILTTIQPIAKIISTDGVLSVEQIARNNYAVTSACINGKILKQFTAL